MKPNKARNLLKPLYYKIDNELDNIPNVCNKGCFFCCYQPIELFKFESVTLGDYIKGNLTTETRNKIKENLLKRLEFFDNNTPNEPLSSIEAFVDFRLKAKNTPTPCPLLINGECGVYKARPMTCRTHFVNDSKDLCEMDKFRDGSKESAQYRQALISELKTKVELEIIPLEYALVQILGIDRPTKKIEKSVLK